MINESNVKILRMQTGEDIISSIHEDTENDMILLNNPMRVVVKRTSAGQSIFMMLPWLPIEIIKEDAAIVYGSDVITIVEPKDSLIEYYNNAVNESILDMLQTSKEIEESLLDEEDDEEQITEEDLKLIEEYKRGKLLH
jgi:hypothetical protein